MLRRAAALLPLAIVGGAPLAQPSVAPPLVGVLAPGRPGIEPGSAFARFVQALADLGLVDGRTIRLEWRFDEMQPARLPAQVAELLALGPAVLVAGTSGASLAARQATTRVPIVMAVSGDPVADGLVASLARPGGNVTGMSIMSPELVGRRLQLLTEAVPGLKRVALLVDTNASRPSEVQAHERAAAALKLELVQVRAGAPQELAAAFDAARRQQVQAMILIQSVLVAMNQPAIAALASQHRMPTVSGSGDAQFARAGGLMNFGPDIGTSWQASASYVHKLLRGASPADLPVQQPSRFQLSLNAATAAALGLSLPQHLLLLADHVIR